MKAIIGDTVHIRTLNPTTGTVEILRPVRLVDIYSDMGEVRYSVMFPDGSIGNGWKSIDFNEHWKTESEATR